MALVRFLRVHDDAVVDGAISDRTIIDCTVIGGKSIPARRRASGREE
jgi:hypothetical protein